MGKAKLKAVPDEPLPLSPQRVPLKETIDKAAAVRAETAANEKAQDEARAKIKEATAAVEDAERELASPSAGEVLGRRRALRAALQAAKDDLEDYADLLDSLKKKAGVYPHVDAFGSLVADLRRAEEAVKAERRKLVAGHPAKTQRLNRLAELRAELHQVTRDLLEFDKIGAMEPGWEALPADFVVPAPDSRIAPWLERLLTDPAAELEA